MEQHKSCSVAERWTFSNGAWAANWAWRRQPTGRSLGDISSILSLMDGLVFDTSKEDEWVWNIESSGNFSVSSLCSLIQKKMLVTFVDSPKFVWNSWVPRKVNFYAWRLALDRLPTRENLSRRGLIHLDSSSCLFCGSDVESKEHCFLSCPKIKLIWLKIWSWWNVPPLFNPSLDDILHGIPRLFSNKWKAKLFHAICLGCIRSVWAWRNRILHASSDEEKSRALREDIFPAVQRMLLLWTSNRAPKNRFSWANWILRPNELLDT
ncbi:RNA-directed DNA polymerase, eukaryota, reverse transcriptase zinc-binding domain protein [Tanacetum coccineum]